MSSVTGVEEVKAKAELLKGNVLPAVGEGAHKWSNEMMNESHSESPYQTREMIRTGKVNDPKYKRSSVTVQSGYNTVYARRQHQEMSYRHPHGKAHFLIDPFLRRKPSLGPTIKEHVLNMIGRLTR
ncbi:MAG: hypothetical protein LLG45_13335 [Actinomycetia bacterium]|nr:hypothetical protein [Actinomycetes bacterium]